MMRLPRALVPLLLAPLTLAGCSASPADEGPPGIEAAAGWPRGPMPTVTVE